MERLLFIVVQVSDPPVCPELSGQPSSSRDLCVQTRLTHPAHPGFSVMPRSQASLLMKTCVCSYLLTASDGCHLPAQTICEIFLEIPPARSSPPFSPPSGPSTVLGPSVWNEVWVVTQGLLPPRSWRVALCFQTTSSCFLTLKMLLRICDLAVCLYVSFHGKVQHFLMRSNLGMLVSSPPSDTETPPMFHSLLSRSFNATLIGRFQRHRVKCQWPPFTVLIPVTCWAPGSPV